MKTETCKLYSRDFWIFPPNIIKIDRYNFELYRFKVGPFFETQCSCELMIRCITWWSFFSTVSWFLLLLFIVFCACVCVCLMCVCLFVGGLLPDSNKDWLNKTHYYSSVFSEIQTTNLLILQAVYYVTAACPSSGLRSTSSSSFALPQLRSRFGERPFSHAGPSAWNALPSSCCRGHESVQTSRQNSLF